MSEVYPKDSTEAHKEPQHMIRALRPDIRESVQKWVLPSAFAHRRQATIHPEFSSNLNRRWHTRRETPCTSSSKTAATLALKQQPIPLAHNNLTKKHWFHSLPFQQFQALLTLFPKSFSSFPHGTCLLSVSNLYLALEENYLPFCAPRPKYATLRSYTGWTKLSAWTGFSPSVTSFSNETYAGDDTGDSAKDYNSKTSFGFTLWALPCSVALTRGIILIFFSSAYLYA